MKHSFTKLFLLAAVALFSGNVWGDDDVTETISPSVCDQLRSDKGTTAKSTATTFEMYTTRDESNAITKDFVGLMSFTVPSKSGYYVKSATLKVITERAKGTLAIYNLGAAIATTDTYDSQSTNITAARKTTPVTCTLAGTSSKAMTDAGASSTLADWTNNIDLTSMVQASADGAVNLLFCNNANSTSTSIKIYTENATDVTNTKVTPNFTFAAADLKPVLTVVYAKDPTLTTSTTKSTADTWVRYNNTTKQGSATTMEIHSTFDDSKVYSVDFVGLMQFEIPAEAKSDKYEIESATLRLTTNMCKGATVFNIYGYSNAFDEANALYSTETSYIDAARQTTPVQFTAKYGSRSKALSDNQTESDSFKGAIENWTNTIDITSLVKAAASNKFQIMIDASTSNTNAAKFYTKEATGFTNSATSVEYTTEQLVPQLTIVYSMKSYDLNVSSAGAATLVLPFDATIPSNVKVYTLDYTSGNTTAKATEVTGTLLKNTPVYVKANEGTYTFSLAEDGTKGGTYNPTYGALTGVYTKTDVPTDSYILYNGSEGVGFYLSNNSTVAPFRAYLTADGNGAKAITISFDDETNGITEVNAKTISNNEVYNLAGQRVSPSTKGIVIINGRKYIQK